LINFLIFFRIYPKYRYFVLGDPRRLYLTIWCLHVNWMCIIKLFNSRSWWDNYNACVGMRTLQYLGRRIFAVAYRKSALVLWDIVQRNVRVPELYTAGRDCIYRYRHIHDFFGITSVRGMFPLHDFQPSTVFSFIYVYFWKHSTDSLPCRIQINRNKLIYPFYAIF